jgi:K+-transporting ATPase ATPase C chain
MKKEIIPSIVLSLACMVLFSVLYPAVIWAIAMMTPGKGEGILVIRNGNTYYRNIAQKFTQDKYFWSRPSAVDYNAAGSGGSNKGPANPDLHKQVQDRLDTLLAHDPQLAKNQVPVDMVTASGSGLDPDISVQGALMQVSRIARVRHLTEGAVGDLVKKHTDKPFLNLFGPEKVNVLELNLDLDQLK